MKRTIVLSILAVLAMSACGGGGSDHDSEFRQLQVGDSWTFTQTTTFTGADGAQVSYVHDHTLTVVENVTDATGKVHPGLAYKSEYIQISGPAAPIGTEYELFSQDPETGDVLLGGNILPTGQFLPKHGTLYVGEYEEGATHEYVGDISNNLITFLGTVIEPETVSALGTSLECWEVDLVETSEPGGQDFYSNGIQTTKVCPALGARADASIEFDIGHPYLGHMVVTSTIKATNVPL